MTNGTVRASHQGAAHMYTSACAARPGRPLGHTTAWYRAYESMTDNHSHQFQIGHGASNTASHGGGEAATWRGSSYLAHAIAHTSARSNHRPGRGAATPPPPGPRPLAFHCCRTRAPAPASTSEGINTRSSSACPLRSSSLQTYRAQLARSLRIPAARRRQHPCTPADPKWSLKSSPRSASYHR